MTEGHNGHNGGGGDAFIGVDVGGTHTDVSVVLGDRVERGKALTTYDDFSRGVLEAVEVAAQRVRRRRWASCSLSTQLFINGTTVVTNTITHAARLEGRRAVHERLQGRLPPRRRRPHDRDRRPPPGQRPRPLRPPRDRRDRRAHRLVGHGARPDRPRRRSSAEARRLVEELDIDAIAICFLWSHANDEHELRRRGGGQGALPRPLRHAVAPRLPGRGRDAALDHGGAELLRPGQGRRLPHLAEHEAARGGPEGRPRVLPGPRRRHQPREGAPVPARPARLGPGRRRDRRQRAGQADGRQGRPARRHGRHELRHRHHRRQRDPHREEPRARARSRPASTSSTSSRSAPAAARSAGSPSAACRRSARRAPARRPGPAALGPRRRASRPSPTRW